MTPVRFVLAVPREPRRDGLQIQVRRAHGAETIGGRDISVWQQDPNDSLVTADSTILLLGRLFQGRNRMAAADLAPLHSKEAKECARWLTDHCWGGWLALLVEPSGDAWIVRAPSPLLPVYRLDTDSHVLLASEIDLLNRAARTQPKVSWSNLTLHLLYPERRGVRTCLAGITEVMPGHLARLDATEQVPLWTPSRFVRPHASLDRAALAAQLRETATSCLDAWTSGDERVAVSASGGLDSSIVCACLRRAGRPFDTVTISTPDPSGDESAWVRKLAGHLGVRMVARTFDPADFALERSASRGLPRPTRKAFMEVLSRLQREACEELGATAILDGNGGDNLFCYLHSAAPIVDRLGCHGVTPALLHTLLDMCRITQCDLGTMLRAAARSWSNRAAPAWHEDERLLTKVRPPDPEPPDCPIELKRLPGKQAHAMLIERARNFLNELTGSSEPMRFSPLMSQPLIELCLQVPSWEWCAGGINRSLAREAFREELPREILERQAKAGPDSVLRSVFVRNRKRIRDMLLGGMLASEGILDREATARALDADAQSEDPIVYRLLDLVEAEAWARSWER